MTEKTIWQFMRYIDPDDENSENALAGSIIEYVCEPKMRNADLIGWVDVDKPISFDDLVTAINRDKTFWNLPIESKFRIGKIVVMQLISEGLVERIESRKSKVGELEKGIFYNATPLGEKVYNALRSYRPPI